MNIKNQEAIKALAAKGKEPRIEVLLHGLKNAETALRVEAAVIDLIGVTNICNQKFRPQQLYRYGIQEQAPRLKFMIVIGIGLSGNILSQIHNHLFNTRSVEHNLYDLCAGGGPQESSCQVFTYGQDDVEITDFPGYSICIPVL